MSLPKASLALAVAIIAAAALAPAGASARAAMTPAYYDSVYCGRLPAYRFDGCGYREFRYGQNPNSCWRRVIVNSPDGPRPRRVFVCDPRARNAPP